MARSHASAKSLDGRAVAFDFDPAIAGIALAFDVKQVADPRIPIAVPDCCSSNLGGRLARQAIGGNDVRLNRDSVGGDSNQTEHRSPVMFVLHIRLGTQIRSVRRMYVRCVVQDRWGTSPAEDSNQGGNHDSPQQAVERDQGKNPIQR